MENVAKDREASGSTYNYSGNTNSERVSRIFQYCDARELPLVRGAVQATLRPAVRITTLWFNHLGNGWLYPLLAPLLIWAQGRDSWRLLLATTLSAAIAHLVYPVIKRRLARRRPCDYDPALALALPVKALDYYSCPSGHCMTATAVYLPIGIAFPAVAPLLLITWLLIAWSRMALAHHYPSDILLGAMLGCAAALPAALWLV
jgi:undecaprenyl-diphosphatase